MIKPNLPDESPLGRQSEYPTRYNPALLYPIPRALGRRELSLDNADLPFTGVDLWTAYELSWLNHNGKPEVALAQLRIPCSSANLIESKSLKLYLNSLNQTRFPSRQHVADTIVADLSAAAGSPIALSFMTQGVPVTLEEEIQHYYCIDELETACNQYLPDAGLLKADERQPRAERLVSHLFKSNCPVTGQPDWASLFIDYQGPGIDHGRLLQYLVSYREHLGFHEQCVERIFTDLHRQCRPSVLTVNARYLRRGGLDINPVRSTMSEYPVVGRTVRQ